MKVNTTSTMRAVALLLKRLHLQIAGAMAALAMLLPVSPAAHAATYSWNNTGTDFAAGGDWTPSGPPGSGDVAQFDELGTLAGGTINNPSLSGSQSVLQLIVSGQASGAGWSFTGSGSLNTLMNSPNAQGLISRGAANTSFDLGDGTATSLHIIGQAGNTAFGAFVIGHGSTVTLTGNTVASFTGSISLRGGSLVLDNSAGNPTSQRITLASSSQSITLAGGGATVEFKSAAGGSTFSGLNAGVLYAYPCEGTIRLNQTGSGALAVTFGSLNITSFAVINFLSTGNGTLGGGGAGDPSIKFTNAPSTTNGVIFGAIYNGTDFANYDATRGVIAATSTDVSGALTSSSTSNINITGNASTFSAASFNTVKITPSATGQSLSLGGTMTTLGILLTGSTDYSITGGGITSQGIRSLFYVTNPSTTLSTNSNLGSTSHFPPTLVKSGPGFLTLTGTTNQVVFSFLSSVQLLGGTMRVTSTNFGSTNVATAFNGGVLEYDVSAAPVTFSRALGTGSGNVRWGSGDGTGSGGFSAYAGSSNGGNGNGNALTVNIGGSSATETWGSTSNFLTDDYALIFGSTKSNSTVNWQNPINLDSGAGNYQIREIKVIKGVGNDADKTIMSGAIAGSSTTDLLKTGDGTLELDATNTYAGATQVSAGTLQLGNGGTTGSLSTSSAITDNGNLTINRSDAVTQGTDFSGSAITGSGSFTQAGSGTTTLTAANTYTGATMVNGGSLFVNGSTASGSAVTVNNSGTLGGNGTINGTVTLKNSAVINPGATIGAAAGAILTTGALTFNDTSTLSVNMTGNPSPAADKIIVATGGVTIGSTAQLQLIIPNGTVFTAGQQFTLIDPNGTNLTNPISGQFMNAPAGEDTINGYLWIVTYMGGTDLNELVLTEISAVPEPATWLASTLALAVLGYKQRRRVARVFKSV